MRSPGTPSSVGYAVSRAPFQKGVRLLVLLNTTVAGMTMNILKNRDIDAREDAIERDDVGVGKPKPHRLVRDSGSQEEQCCIAAKVVPAFLRKMERLVKHETEEILFRTQTNPQNEGDQCVESGLP